jgi:hypothetical protein
MAEKPTGLADVVVVEQVGGVVSVDTPSPSTKPEYDALRAGTALPYTIVSEGAVMVRGAGAT